jgi:hypothetical protein
MYEYLVINYCIYLESCIPVSLEDPRAVLVHGLRRRPVTRGDDGELHELRGIAPQSSSTSCI